MSLQKRFNQYIKRKYTEIINEEEANRAIEEKTAVVQLIEDYLSGVPDRKKILLFAHEIKPLGGSILLNNIALYLHDNSYRIVILTNPRCEIDKDTLQMLPEDILVINLSDNQEWNMTVFDAIARNGVERCLMNTVISGQYTKIFKEIGFSVVTLVHEMTASCRILKAEQLAQNICNYSDITVFPSHTAKEEFEEFASMSMKNETIIRPQGLYKNSGQYTFTKATAREKLYELYEIPQNAIVLVGIGGINFGKGVDQLVPTLLELRKRNQYHLSDLSEKTGKEPHIIWMGKVEDQAYAEWVKVEIHKAGLDEYWHWAGYISNEEVYFEILKGGDVFVLPSREDTYPSVALDAASVAIPIAAFEYSGGGADIAYNQHGLLADVGDIVNYAKLIEYLAEDFSVSEKCWKFSIEIKNKNNFINYCKLLESDFERIRGSSENEPRITR